MENNCYAHLYGESKELIRIYLPITNNVLLMMLDLGKEHAQVHIITQMVPFKLVENQCLLVDNLPEELTKELLELGAIELDEDDIFECDGRNVEMYTVNTAMVRYDAVLEAGFPLAQKYVNRCEDYRKYYEKVTGKPYDMNEVKNAYAIANNAKPLPVSNSNTAQAPDSSTQVHRHQKAFYKEEDFKDLTSSTRSIEKWNTLSCVIAKQFGWY